VTIEYLEKVLVNWKRILLVNVGASITLLATAIADIPNHPNPFFPGWYGVWFILQLATTIPVLVLVLSGRMRKLSLAERLDTIFGFCLAAWIALISFGLKSQDLISNSFLSLSYCGVGIALGMIYWLLRRRCVSAPEATFP
jgi:hypothetical protein